MSTTIHTKPIPFELETKVGRSSARTKLLVRGASDVVVDGSTIITFDLEAHVPGEQIEVEWSSLDEFAQLLTEHAAAIQQEFNNQGFVDTVETSIHLRPYYGE
jgi:hypothetical protein